LAQTLADSLAWDLDHFDGAVRGAGLSDPEERELLTRLVGAGLHAPSHVIDAVVAELDSG
jgi:hypothetical protein